MKIRVRVFGPLKRYLPGQAEDVSIEVSDGTTVDDLMKQRSIPDEDVFVVTVNGARVQSSHVLKDGDEICMFSPVGGG